MEDLQARAANAVFGKYRPETVQEEGASDFASGLEVWLLRLPWCQVCIRSNLLIGDLQGVQVLF
jgi:hypothetical protein